MRRQSLRRSRRQAGFTLIEMMVGILIIAATATTVFYGVAYARADVRRVIIRERALEELAGYMDYWVAKIHNGSISQGDIRGDARGEEVVIYNPTNSDDEEDTIIGTITREPLQEYYNQQWNPNLYPYYYLKARITWDDHLAAGEPAEIYLEAKVFEL